MGRISAVSGILSYQVSQMLKMIFALGSPERCRQVACTVFRDSTASCPWCRCGIGKMEGTFDVNTVVVVILVAVVVIFVVVVAVPITL